MPGGFTDPGHKTVIPARAAAKLSMRLVPDQDPQEITGLFEQYVRSFLPPTVQLTIHRLGSALPAVVDVKAPAVRAMAHAFELGFGAAPYYFRGGGSLPIVRHLQDALAAPVVLIGFGLPDDNSHAPNERLHLPNWHRGIETLVHYLAILGGQE
jgi:acetylornithine deacetylase/succinyl-diaminopimelate desuccinylase-like protein